MSQPKVPKLENTPRDTTGLMQNALALMQVRYSSTKFSILLLAGASIGHKRVTLRNV